MSVYHWSKTASNNATYDPGINWQEGQLPSTINNSARAMMAAIAAWRDDTGGLSVLGGSGNSFEITLAQPMASLSHGLFSFIATRSNTGPATLAVDGLPPRPLRQTTGVDLTPYQITQGRIYNCTYNAAGNEFLLNGSFSLGASDLPRIGNKSVSANISGADASPVGLSFFDLSVAVGVPQYSRTLFLQAAAPSGWTKVTDHDNKAIRIVSGAGGGSGGSVAFSTAFTSKSVVGTIGGTALTVAQLPAHSHRFGTTRAFDAPGGGNPTIGGGQPANATGPHTNTDASNGGIENTGSGQTHTHSFTGTNIDLAVAYVDAIICQKDAP